MTWHFHHHVGPVGRPCRVVLGAVLLLGPAPAGLAAAELSDLWRLGSESGIATGYDSNVLGAGRDEDGVHDAFVAVHQEASLARRNSLTQLALNGRAGYRRYFQETTAGGWEGELQWNAGYPNDQAELRDWDASAYWRSRKEVDVDLGRRVRRQDYGAAVASSWHVRPKLELEGSLEVAGYDYVEAGLNDSDVLTLGLGLAHAWNPKLRWSIDYRAAFGRSRGDPQVRDDTRSTIHTVGLRARGELRPKLVGSVFLGFARAAFRGFADRTDSGPGASAELRWSLSPKTELRTSAGYLFGFSPEGEARKHAFVALTWEQQFGPGWRAHVRVAPYRTTYARSARTREDQGVNLGGGVDYGLTERFRAGVSLDWSDNGSTLAAYDLRRAQVLLNASYRY